MEDNPEHLAKLLEDLPRHRSSLLPALERAQTRLRYLPAWALEAVSEHTRTPKSEVYGVASHYPEFRLKEPGRRIVRVCSGMGCVAKGAPGLLADLESRCGVKAGQTTPDSGITLEEATCLFNCPHGPSVEIDHQTYGHASLDMVSRRLAQVGYDHHHTPAGNGHHPLRPTLTGQPSERLTQLINEAIRKRTGEGTRLLVGAGSCANSVGAGEVTTALRNWAESAALFFSVIEAGCNGMCYGATLVTVERPDRPAVTAVGVNAENAVQRIQAIFADDLAAAGELFRWAGESYNGVVSYKETPFFAKQRRVLLANCGIVDPTDIDDYLLRGGYAGLVHAVGELSPQQVIDEVMRAELLGGYAGLVRAIDELSPGQVSDEVKRAGLMGRGGAYFPTALKWEAARKAAGQPKYLVVNAEEGEPGIYKDRHLMEGDPHRLIEGMAIAAYAIGAGEVIFYINGEARLAQQRVAAALRQAEACGLIGEDVLGSGVSISVEVRHGAGGYILGEETALLESIEGYRAMPRVRPPFPTEAGLWGKPTVINNAETLANVVGITRHGADWYNGLGVEGARGTKLIGLSGNVARPGLVEIELGTKVEVVVNDIGGGVSDGRGLKMVLAAGPSGYVMSADALSLPMVPRGEYLVGSGGLVVLDDRHDTLDVVRRLTRFNMRESCGKCTPCREGTVRLIHLLDRLIDGGTTDDLGELRKLNEIVAGASLCGLGQMAPNPINSALRYFGERAFARHSADEASG